MAQALMNLGKGDAAMAMYRKQIKLAEVHLEMNPDDPRACILAAGSYAAIGDKEKASEFTQRAIAADPEDPMLLYNVACTYSQLGKLEEALNALQHAVDNGYGDRPWMEHDADLDPLRSLPRYQSIVQAM